MQHSESPISMLLVVMQKKKKLIYFVYFSVKFIWNLQVDLLAGIEIHRIPEIETRQCRIERQEVKAVPD